jgi:translation elongation factor EF-1alpha
MAEEKKLVGRITHYFTNIGVAVIELEDTLKVGDEISVEGATTNFTQKIDSMQIEHESVKEAKKGDSVGLKVVDKVREGDQVFKV